MEQAASTVSCEKCLGLSQLLAIYGAYPDSAHLAQASMDTPASQNRPVICRAGES